MENSLMNSEFLLESEDTNDLQVAIGTQPQQVSGTSFFCVL